MGLLVQVVHQIWSGTRVVVTMAVHQEGAGWVHQCWCRYGCSSSGLVQGGQPCPPLPLWSNRLILQQVFSTCAVPGPLYISDASQQWATVVQWVPIQMPAGRVGKGEQGGARKELPRIRPYFWFLLGLEVGGIRGWEG